MKTTVIFQYLTIVIAFFGISPLFSQNNYVVNYAQDGPPPPGLQNLRSVINEINTLGLNGAVDIEFAPALFTTGIEISEGPIYLEQPVNINLHSELNEKMEIHGNGSPGFLIINLNFVTQSYITMDFVDLVFSGFTDVVFDVVHLGENLDVAFDKCEYIAPDYLQSNYQSPFFIETEPSIQSGYNGTVYHFFDCRFEGVSFKLLSGNTTPTGSVYLVALNNEFKCARDFSFYVELLEPINNYNFIFQNNIIYEYNIGDPNNIYNSIDNFHLSGVSPGVLNTDISSNEVHMKGDHFFSLSLNVPSLSTLDWYGNKLSSFYDPAKNEILQVSDYQLTNIPTITQAQFDEILGKVRLQVDFGNLPIRSSDVFIGAYGSNTTNFPVISSNWVNGFWIPESLNPLGNGNYEVIIDKDDLEIFDRYNYYRFYVLYNPGDFQQGSNYTGEVHVPLPCDISDQKGFLTAIAPLSGSLQSVPSQLQTAVFDNVPIDNQGLVWEVAPYKELAGFKVPDWTSANRVLRTSPVFEGQYTENTNLFPVFDEVFSTGGKVAWRVGILLANGNYFWSDIQSLSFPLNAIAPLEAYYEEFLDEHANRINWNYEANFFDGKVAESMMYSDGLGLTRQQQAKNQVTGSILTQETVYSPYHSDQATTLVAPGAQNQFRFSREFFDVFDGLSGFRDFSAKDFDIINSDPTSGYYHTPSVTDGTRAFSVGNYYSDIGLELGVDNANGYPYTYNMTFEDGRPDRTAAGVGSEFLLTDRAIKYLYGNASNQEVHLMYGSGSGLEGSIKKTTVLDANQVGHISYTNQEGLVVATAIQQCPAIDHLGKLKPKADNDYFGPGEPFTQEYLDVFKNRIEPLAGNNEIVVRTGQSNQVTARFTLPCEENLIDDFYYDLVGEIVTYEVLDECYVCGYTITIEVKNELTGEVVDELSYRYDINPEELSCEDNEYPGPTPLLGGGSPVMLPGPATYIVTRTVEPYETANASNSWEEEYNKWKEEFENKGSGYDGFKDEFFSYETYFVKRSKETSDYSPYNPITEPCYNAYLQFGNGTDCNREGMLSAPTTAFSRPIAVEVFGEYTYILEEGSASIRRFESTTSAQNIPTENFAGTPCQNTYQLDGALNIGAFANPSDMIIDQTNSDRLIVLESQKAASYPTHIRYVDRETGVLSPFLISNIHLLDLPEAIAMKSDGTLFLANTGGGNIVTIDVNGNASVYQIPGVTFSSPSGIAVDEEKEVLWISDRGGNKVYGYHYGAGTNEVTTIGSLSGTAGFQDHEIPTQVRFSAPERLKLNNQGELFVSESGNNAIRVIDTYNYAVTTAVGSGQPGMEDGFGGEASFNQPKGIDFGLENTILVCDLQNNRLRYVQSTRCAVNEDDCEFDGSCTEVIDYLDEVWLDEQQTGTAYPYFLTLLEGGYATPDPSDDEFYEIGIGASQEIYSGAPEWVQFENLYERQYDKEPPVLLAMERITITQDNINGQMPMLLDGGLIDPSDTRPYVLYKVVLNYGDCQDLCELKASANSSPQAICENERALLEADLQLAGQEIDESDEYYLYDGQYKTLDQWLSIWTPLTDELLDNLTDNDAELYDNYMAALYALNDFSFEKCLAEEEGQEDICEACADDLSLEIIGLATSIIEDYSDFLEHPAFDGVNYGFPFTFNELEGPVIDGYPSEEIVNLLGERLARFFLDEYQLIKDFNTAAEWEEVVPSGTLQLAILDRLNDPQNGLAYGICNEEMMRKLQIIVEDLDNNFPAILLDLLLLEFDAEDPNDPDDRDGEIYEALKDCGQNQDYNDNDWCEDLRAQCLDAAEDIQDLTLKANMIADCNNQTCDQLIEKALTSEVILELNRWLNLQGTTLDPNLYEEAISELVNEAKNLAIQQGQSIQHILEHELAQLAEIKVCVLSCEGELEEAYNEWVNRYLITVRKSFEESYTGNCVQKLQEDFWLEYTDIPVHFTMYEYDQGQRLKSTVPPEGVDYVLFPEEPCHRMKTEYRYDAEQVVEQISPDGGITRFLYDDQGRLRFSQSSEQRARSKITNQLVFSYNIYDGYNRVKEVGEYYDYEGLIGGWSPECLNCGGTTTNGPLTIPLTFFLNSNFPLVSNSVADETKFTYDITTYSFPRYPQENVSGRVSAVTNEFGSTHFSYDARGRVRYVLHDVKDLDEFNNKWVEYKYEPTSGTLKEVIYMEGVESEEFHHRFIYDDNNRLVRVDVGEIIEVEDDWLTVAQYQYYDHGPLKQKLLGDGTQKIDYLYNINGWLKAINNPNNLTESDPDIADDVFAELLVYHSGDYSRLGASVGPGDLTKIRDPENNGTPNDLYNGNISAIVYHSDYERVADQLASQSPGSNPIEHSYTISSLRGRNVLAQGYKYDVLNRLEQVFSEEYSATGLYSITNGSDPADGDYFSSYAYDANGNLLELNRNFRRGDDYSKNSFGFRLPNNNYQLDRLSYTYNNAIPTNHPDYNYFSSQSCYTGNYKLSNRLNHVNDNAANTVQSDLRGLEDQSTNNYEYDPSGRLIRDLKQNIEKIEWNSLGKVSRVVKNGPDALTIDFTYNPMGKRQSKTVKKRTDGSLLQKTVYVYGADDQLLTTYNVLPSATAGQEFEYNVGDVPLYGINREGLFNRQKEVVDNEIDDDIDIDYTAIVNQVVRNTEEQLEETLNEIDSIYSEVNTQTIPGVSDAAADVINAVEDEVRKEVNSIIQRTIDTLNWVLDHGGEIDVFEQIENLQHEIYSINVTYTFSEEWARDIQFRLSSGVQDQYFDVHLKRFASIAFAHTATSITQHNIDYAFNHKVQDRLEETKQLLDSIADPLGFSIEELYDILYFDNYLDLRFTLRKVFDASTSSDFSAIYASISSGDCLGDTLGVLRNDDPQVSAAISNRVLLNAGQQVSCDIPVEEGGQIRIDRNVQVENLNVLYMIVPEEGELGEDITWNGLPDDPTKILATTLSGLLGGFDREDVPSMIVQTTDETCVQLDMNTIETLQQQTQSLSKDSKYPNAAAAVVDLLNDNVVSIQQLANNTRSIGEGIVHNLDQILGEVVLTLSRFSVGEREFNKANEEGPIENFIEYEITDHLGNVRATVSHNKADDGEADIKSMQDYYPYGMVMPGRQFQSASGYRYGFQGQELDNELKGYGNSVNYTFRMHDPRVGRFFSVDPLSAQYPKWSPYAFSGNQVIHTVELEGLEPETDFTNSPATGGCNGNDSFVNSTSSSSESSSSWWSETWNSFSSGASDLVNWMATELIMPQGMVNAFEAMQYKLQISVDQTMNYGKRVEETVSNGGSQEDVDNYYRMEKVRADVQATAGLVQSTAEAALLIVPAEELALSLSSRLVLRYGLPLFTTFRMNPAKLARAWQGRGIYPGIDNWRNITLVGGKYVVGGLPGQSNFYTTLSGLNRSGLGKNSLFQGLQISKHPQFGYRSHIGIYRVGGNTPAAFGTTYANPQFGSGGLPQLFIPDYSGLQLIKTIPLKL